MPIAHSLFKQTVLNVRSHQLQQLMIEICCKMILTVTSMLLILVLL